MVDINFDAKLKEITDIATKLTLKIVTEGQADQAVTDAEISQDYNSFGLRIKLATAIPANGSLSIAASQQGFKLEAKSNTSKQFDSFPILCTLPDSENAASFGIAIEKDNFLLIETSLDKLEPAPTIINRTCFNYFLMVDASVQINGLPNKPRPAQARI